VIIEHVVDEVPTQIGTTLASSSSFVLEPINDPPFVPNQTIAIESNLSPSFLLNLLLQTLLISQVSMPHLPVGTKYV